MTVVDIPGGRIHDALSFHAVFAEALGFPGFYGRNMDAWIDCMGHLDDPAAEMSGVHVAPGGQLTLNVVNAGHVKAACPQVWLDFLECAAAVNARCLAAGRTPLLIVAS